METQTAGPASNLEMDPADRTVVVSAHSGQLRSITRQDIGPHPQRGPHPQGREVHGAQASLEAGGAGQVDIFLPGESTDKILNTGRHPGTDCSGKC